MAWQVWWHRRGHTRYAKVYNLHVKKYKSSAFADFDTGAPMIEPEFRGQGERTVYAVRRNKKYSQSGPFNVFYKWEGKYWKIWSARFIDDRRPVV